MRCDIEQKQASRGRQGGDGSLLLAALGGDEDDGLAILDDGQRFGSKREGHRRPHAADVVGVTDFVFRARDKYPAAGGRNGDGVIGGITDTDSVDRMIAGEICARDRVPAVRMEKRVAPTRIDRQADLRVFVEREMGAARAEIVSGKGFDRRPPEQWKDLVDQVEKDEQYGDYHGDAADTHGSGKNLVFENAPVLVPRTQPDAVRCR